MTACTALSVRVAATRIAIFLLIALSPLLSPSLFAQTASPRVVEFDPSPDHGRSVDGVALVDRYTVGFFAVGGASPLQVIELGKPSVESDGKIRVDFTASLGTWPADGVTYEARVTVFGPGGSTTSSVSNTFVFPGTSTPPPAPPVCSPSLSTTSRGVSSSGASGAVGVTVASGCDWNAASDAGWLTITSGSSGSGNGSVAYSVSANSSPSVRVAHLSIGGLSFTLTQSGVSCTYSLSSTTRTATSGATTGSVNVTAGSSCTWTASSDVNWLSVSSGANGSGGGTVNYSATANPSSTLRIGHLTIAGIEFTFSQTGVPCTYSISTASRSAASGATSGSVSVDTVSGCAWTAASDANWLTITNGTAGSGDGSVSYSVPANPATSQRVGRLTIAGSTFTLTQGGASCTYSISPTTRTIASGAATGSVSISAGSGCAWTASSSDSWLTLTGNASGSGNGTVSYNVAANSGSSVRDASITVGSATFTVTQNGSCTYTITPTSQGFNPAGGTASISVSAGSGCSWSASRSGTWITITSGSSGSGNGTVRYRVSANTGSSGRTGTLTVAGQPVPITQPAATSPNAPAGLRIVTVR